MNSSRHLQLRFVLGTIAEWGIVAWLAYKLLCVISTALEWICCNMLSSTTAVGIGIMLIGLLGVAAVLYTPRGEGGKDDV